MKISLDWLRTHLDGAPALVAEDVAERLTHAGLQLAGIEPSPVSPADRILDIEVTSNRNDCNSHRGMARDVAALVGVQLTAPPPLPQAQGPAGPSGLVTVEAPDLCPHYTARIIRGVKVGPSPAWLADRLRAIGQRPVNNIVDITNYVLFDLGQPLHAFDLARLRGAKIVVRRARKGEAFEAIDHSKHQLDSTMCVIADAERAVALAGVMGGVDSEVTAATTDVLLESARFDPLTTRNTGRRLALRSESGYRFERGVDPVGVLQASELATALILQLAGGRVEGGLAQAGSAYDASHLAPGAGDAAPAGPQVTLRFARLRRLLGFDIPAARCVEILGRLGFRSVARDEHGVTVCIPSWRLDCAIEEDLVEEVARIQGYQHVPMHPRLEITLKTPSVRQRVTAALTRALTGSGFRETINPSMIEDELVGLFTAEPPLRVSARHRRQHGSLRDTLVASLLQVARHNQQAGAVGAGGLRLYELATCFVPRGTGELPVQPLRLGLLTDGAVRELRGVVEALLTDLRLGSRAVLELADHPGTQAGVALAVRLDGQAIGWLGRLDAAVARTLGLRGAFCVGELDVEPLLAAGLAPSRLAELPRFPAVQRDLSLVVADQLRWADLERTIRAVGVEALAEVQFGEVFRGKGLPAGSKSVFVNLLFRSPQRSLTHEEVDGWQGQIVARLQADLGATLRTA